MVATRMLRISGKCYKTMGIWPGTELLLQGGLSSRLNRSALLNMLIQGAHCECFPMYKDLCSANDQNSIAEWLVSTSVDTRHVGVLPSIEWEGLCCCIA